jgi:cell division protease FtsH
MPSTPAPSPRRWTTIAFVLGFLVFALLQAQLLRSEPTRSVSYTELLGMIDGGSVTSVEIDDHEIRARIKAPKGKPSLAVAERIPGIDDQDLLRRLEQAHVEVRGEHENNGWQSLLWSTVVPLLILSFFWSRLGAKQRRGGPLSFGRSRMKLYDRTQTERVSFSDVAGVDEAQAELAEVVDFLRNPQKYRALGARTPKGVLLLGPPGTGKTLLAKAVAGEADVSFFSLSGSDFVEMFVGVGAARVRDLFEQAKERAPCIVFIDELDAIGKSRGGLSAMGSNEEREQTLNQLLVEMDGFDASSGVVLMAATNRPEILDPALVRAGRFDRQVLVDRPDLKGREEILRVHARKLKLADDVDLHVIAQRTPGMVGADLANVVNEAAIGAARRGGSTIEQRYLEEAIDREQLGLKKKGRAMTEAEKRRVAYHESGHTLVALSMKHADPVHRVSIIPRSIGALGVTLQLPTEDRYLMTEEELADQICVMFGGRAAEQLVFGVVSTGAQNDLERATELVRQMVCRYGMGEELGPLTYGKSQNLRFLAGAGSEERNYSEDTARAIDQQTRRIVDREYARALDVLSRHKDALNAVAQRLLKVETLSGEELHALLASQGEQASTGAAAAQDGQAAPRAVPV